jgi:hypothetical protein
MFKLNSKLMAAAALSAVLLSGCGDGNGNGVAGAPPGPMEETITAVVNYIQNLIASNGENTDPIDINPLTLAADDTSEPAPLQ